MKPGSTERTTLRRISHKASKEQSDLFSILDDNLVAHVGVVENGQPLVIPMTYGRSGNTLYLHGSTGSRLMRLLAENSNVCISVTELNALKVARSTFNSGMHYRAAVIFGKATLVGDEEKLSALDALSDGLIPGRNREARPTTKKELAATIIISVQLDETSVKISKNEVDDPEEDMNKGYWAGIVPIKTIAGEPIPADEESARLSIPPSILSFVAQRQGS
jgi:nitroimidazol reductase NimA-like FMN-containing flavoprotein (pyridoxamine 5'-phosphate oxidase superfamily)